VKILHDNPNFGGYLAHLKALGVSAAVYAAKGIIQSSTTA